MTREALTLDDLRRAHALRESIYDRFDGGAGCCWHVLLDDRNVDDAIVESCLRDVNRAHDDCVEIGPLILRMSKTQRLKLAARGYAALAKEGS